MSTAEPADFDPEKEREDRKRQIGIAALIIVLVGAVSAGLLWSQSGPSGPVHHIPKLKTAQVGYSLAMGNRSAKLHVVVYEDFGCTACRDFDFASRDYLRDDATLGKAYVEYRPVGLASAYSARAVNALAAVLTAKGATDALKYHDLLFDNQPEAGSTPPDDSFLIDLASKAGAKAPDVQGSIDSMAFQDWITNGNKSAQQAHVTDTPTVLVNGSRLRAGSVEDLASNLETMIAREG